MSFKLFNAFILNIAILIHLCEIEHAKKTIPVSNIEISFDNKGDFTDFILNSTFVLKSTLGQLENVWMGVGFGPNAGMVKLTLLLYKKTL